MICFIALIVFAVLGVFSAKYRGYFFEASDCIFRRVTLRKCNTSFDTKMKVKISTKASKLSKPFGGFIFRHFEALSWLLTIIMIVSIIWSGYTGAVAVYNFVAFGDCNGPNSGQVCVLNEVSKPLINLDWLFGKSDVNAACAVSQS